MPKITIELSDADAKFFKERAISLSRVIGTALEALEEAQLHIQEDDKPDLTKLDRFDDAEGHLNDLRQPLDLLFYSVRNAIHMIEGGGEFDLKEA